MYKKIFSIIIILNICLYFWQTILSISLSTQGDTLSNYLHQADEVKSQTDRLHQEISANSSLTRIYPQAVARGFVPAQVVSLNHVQLASAGLK